MDTQGATPAAVPPYRPVPLKAGAHAVDGVRDFVDHYHTCFVMKALTKVHALTGHAATLKALGKGVSYYLSNLFDADGLPKPRPSMP